MAANIDRLKFKKVVCDDNSDGEDEDSGSSCLDLSLDKLNLGPKKKLLVLSLNGLLIHRVFVRNNATTIPGYRRPDGKYGNHLVFKRPFSDEFMKFCFDRFEVGIWSSAMEHNIDGVLDCVMKGMRNKLLFVWDQHECTDTGFMSLEKKEKPLFLKELKKLWENEENKLPWRKGQYSSSNTLIIDDKPCKALLNPPNTAIFPESYDADDTDDVVLDPKGELGQFLDGLADAKDVQEFVEQHPYGQPAITPLHSEWSFYSKVVRHFRRG